MPQERGYIPENQQVQTQPEPEQKRPHTSRLRRIVEVGAVMGAMLAVNAGFIEAAKKPNNNEPEVQPLVGADILGGIGSFDNPGVPPSPTGWNPVPTDISPNYPASVAQNGFAVDVETSGTFPCQSNGWKTQEYAINPNNTYKLQFAAVYRGSESPHGIDPKVTLDWENSQSQSLNTPGHIFSGGAPDGDHNGGSWGLNTWTYGPGQNAAIPQQAVKVIVEIQGNQTDPSCSGKLYYDNLALTITSEPTPPPSVGGIAEMPDLPPAATVSHSSKDTLVTNVEIAVGSAAALAAAGIAGAEANRRRKRRG